MTGINLPDRLATAQTDTDHGPPIFMMCGLAPDLAFGVLRRTYRGKANQADTWVHAKLHPAQQNAPPVQAMNWLPNCRRHDVLLPAGVADILLNPALLVHSYEAEASSYRKDLVIHLKLTASNRGMPQHEFWECARSFAREALVMEARLPVILALHDPALTTMRYPPAAHVHIMAPARRLEATGWGAASDLANDEAHSHFANIWAGV